jgi:hypothetical protein
LPRLADFLTFLPPLWELAMALFDRPPPDRAPSLRRLPPDRAASRLPPAPRTSLRCWPPDRATARWPPLCALALVLALLRLEAPRTLCFFTSRAGLGAVSALLGFALADCAPGRLGAGFAASALARVGLRVATAPAPAWRWTAGRAPAEGFLAASPGASAGRLTDAGARPALPSPSEATR